MLQRGRQHVLNFMKQKVEFEPDQDKVVTLCLTKFYNLESEWTMRGHGDKYVSQDEK